tara:strand:- start:257 stop:610 length:354 start_codon:yes stop_codon:yes gene_type:complete
VRRTPKWWTQSTQRQRRDPDPTQCNRSIGGKQQTQEERGRQQNQRQVTQLEFEDFGQRIPGDWDVGVLVCFTRPSVFVMLTRIRHMQRNWGLGSIEAQMQVCPVRARNHQRQAKQRY